MNRAFLFLVISFALLSCAGDDSGEPGKPNASHSRKPGWTDVLQTSFTTNCTDGVVSKPTKSGTVLDQNQAQSLCHCALDGMMILYTPDQLKNNKQQAANDAINVASNCAQQQGLISTNDGTELSDLDQSIDDSLSEL